MNKTEKTIFRNTLQVYLEEVLSKKDGKKLVILGCKRVSIFIYCGILALGSDVEFFVDPEMDESETANRTFMGKPVFSMHRLLYENPSELAVILSVHYRNHSCRKLENYGFKENEDFFNLHGYQSVKNFNVFDPISGFSREEDIGGFHIHGNDDNHALRIVTIGGATTDYDYSKLRSWPDYLHEILEENGIPNVIFNGGVNGFTSCDERNLVLRDVPCLKPDMVIDLSGECDIGYIMVDQAHPWYSKGSAQKLGGILRAHKPHDMKLWFDEVENNSEIMPIKSDSRNWIDNQRIMHASLKTYGIPYYGFLQPIIFEGNYEMSDFEKKCMDIFLTEGNREISSIGLIFDEGKRFYREVREFITECDYIYDLSGVFDHVSGVYSDGVHYDEEGNRIIAQAIYDRLFKAIDGKVEKV